eukprot:1161926-Pelagomonas_calceolata.AAC.2
MLFEKPLSHFRHADKWMRLRFLKSLLPRCGQTGCQGVLHQGMGEQGGAQLLISLLTLALAASALPRSSQVLYTQADDEWAAGVASIAEGIVKTSSSCVPENTVILTMSNGYHCCLATANECRKDPELKMLLASSQVMWTGGDIGYLVITIDADAHAKCNNHTAIQHCFLYHTELAPSDWKKADYYAIVYIKIKAMKALMERGLPAFFFDTDIVFFKVPPFPPPNSYDLVYQMEHFDMACELKSGTQGGPYESADKSCRGHGINTGQFGLWPSNTTITLLSETFKCGLRSTSPGYRGPPIGTQDCMNGALLGSACLEGRMI